MDDRLEGALTGLVVGDALAMPAHWYYQVDNLRRDLDEIKEMRAPQPHHPESMLGGMTYGGSIDILHDKAPLYAGVSAKSVARSGGEALRDSHGNVIAQQGQQPMHYHLTLARGQNTANVAIARLLMRYLGREQAVGGAAVPPQYEGSDPVEFMERWFEPYICTPPPVDAPMSDPGQVVNHNDAYLDKYLRQYFEARSAGVSCLHAAGRQRDDWSIGSLDGVVMALPLIVGRASVDPEAMLVARAVEHAKLTHDSIAVFSTVAVVAPLIQQLLVTARHPDELLREAGNKVHMPAITGFELIKSYRDAKGPGNIPKPEKWAQHNTFVAQTVTQALDGGLLGLPPVQVCGGATPENRLATACYTEHGLAAVLYLALKFGDDFRGAQEANVALGGHSTARGALLGCIMGARVGMAGIPAAWISELAAPNVVQADVAAVRRYSTAAFAAMARL